MRRTLQLALLLAAAAAACVSALPEKANGRIDAKWLARHELDLRRILNILDDARLELKTVTASASPEFQLATIEVVRPEGRKAFIVGVSNDGRRVVYDQVYELSGELFAAARKQIALAGSPARGPADAPLLVVEYSDYTCGYCRKFFDQLEQPLLERYAGRVRFVYKHFPLVGARSWSAEASLAGACAYRQGDDAYWRYHPLMFRQSHALNKGRELLVRLANEAGLDEAAFQKCFDTRAAWQDVLRDTREGQRLGVNGTPTFYLNGRPIEGLLPAPLFFRAIEQELAAAGKH